MIRAGLYGTNGHQIQRAFVESKSAKLVATACISSGKLPSELPDQHTIRTYTTLTELLADQQVEFISLCSPRRADQAADAILALHAGKHVLAEKPCAMNESDLDAILEAALSTGKTFHEMAGTAFGQPYFAMREIIHSGRIGEVIQIIAEKSYPYFDGRPQDEYLDGGLVMQNGIHALRFVEHVAGTSIASIHAEETTWGNPVGGGGLRMASSMSLTLQNGGVATISANYLNPPGTGVWGDESLKILGSRGIIESRAGGAWTRLVIGSGEPTALDTSGPGISWTETIFQSLQGNAKMPISLEEELSPTRWAIRAAQGAKRRQ